MTAKSVRRVIVTLGALLSCLCLCQGAFAVGVQPFLCASQSDGSVVRWVNVQGHNAIGITIRQRNDQGGGKLEGLQEVPGNSVVSVITIPSSTSSNVIVQLALKTSTNQVLLVGPTSTSGTTYNWNLAQYGLTSSQKIAKMAIFARNTTGMPGSIFLRHFVLNGSHLTDEITPTAGCLSY